MITKMDVTFWAWGIGSAIAILVLVIVFIVRVGRRRGWWAKKERKEVKPSLPICPICGKPMAEAKRMPVITHRPKEHTVLWFKILRHWVIMESDLLACVPCAETAWSECRLKREEIYTVQARQRETLMKDLHIFQIRLFTPLKERDKLTNNG